jgi:hypothetical protein
MAADESAPDPGLTASGAAPSGGSATLSGAAPLTATGHAISSGTATVSGAVGLTATGHAISGGTATVSGAVGLSATGHAISGGTATLSREEFRDLSIAACRAALARLEAKTGTDPRDIFAEVGEVLFWLYALGDVGNRCNDMHAGLRWARFMHGHGCLLTHSVYYDHGAALGHFVLAQTALGAKP